MVVWQNLFVNHIYCRCKWTVRFLRRRSTTWRTRTRTPSSSSTSWGTRGSRRARRRGWGMRIEKLVRNLAVLKNLKILKTFLQMTRWPSLLQEDMIREMALQQKKKKQEESSACHLSWNCKTATSTTGGIWTFLPPIYKYSEILYAQKTCRSCRSQVGPCFSQVLAWLIGWLVGWLVGLSGYALIRSFHGQVMCLTIYLHILDFATVQNASNVKQ